MTDEKLKILEMLESGKITPEQATMLLKALGDGSADEGEGESVGCVHMSRNGEKQFEAFRKKAERIKSAAEEKSAELDSVYEKAAILHNKIVKCLDAEVSDRDETAVLETECGRLEKVLSRFEADLEKLSDSFELLSEQSEAIDEGTGGESETAKEFLDEIEEIEDRLEELKDRLEEAQDKLEEAHDCLEEAEDMREEAEAESDGQSNGDFDDGKNTFRIHVHGSDFSKKIKSAVNNTINKIDISKLVEDAVNLGKTGEEIGNMVGKVYDNIGAVIGDNYQKIFTHFDTDKEDGFSNDVYMKAKNMVVIKQKKQSDKPFSQCTIKIKYSKGAGVFNGKFDLSKNEDLTAVLKPVFSEKAWEVVSELIDEKFIGNCKFIYKKEILRVEIS